MKIGEIKEISFGKYSGKYIITAIGYGVITFRRCQLPKSKIDSIRMPEYISITYFG